MRETIFLKTFGIELKEENQRNFSEMKYLMFIISIFGTISSIAQINYDITINTPDAFQGNLFFQKGGGGIKTVHIIAPDGNELFSENWGLKGWDFKVNDNDHITYFDRTSTDFNRKYIHFNRKSIDFYIKSLRCNEKSKHFNTKSIDFNENQQILIENQ